MQSSDATTLYYVWKQEQYIPMGRVNMSKQETNQHCYVCRLSVKLTAGLMLMLCWSVKLGQGEFSADHCRCIVVVGFHRK